MEAMNKLAKPINSAVGAICVTILMIVDTIPAEAGMAIFGALVGVGTTAAAAKAKS